MTFFCSLETFESAKECNGEKKNKLEIKISDSNQTLNQLFWNPSGFESRYLKVSVFEPKVFLQILRFWRDIFTACRNSSQQFYQSLHFGIFSLQCVQFWIGEEKMRPTSSQFFTTRRSLVGDFYSVPDIVIILGRPSVFEPKELQSIRFKKNNDFKRTEFVGNSTPQSKFLVSIYTVKTR